MLSRYFIKADFDCDIVWCGVNNIVSKTINTLHHAIYKIILGLSNTRTCMLHHTISACIWNRKHRYNETLIYILIIHSCIDIYLTYIIRVYLLTYILYARIYRIYLLFHHISSKRKRNVITIVIIIISYFVFYSVYLSYIIFIRRKEVILDTALLISRRITTVILNVFLDSNSFNFLAMHIKVHKLITIQNCHSLSYHTTATYEYTNPGFVYHL